MSRKLTFKKRNRKSYNKREQKKHRVKTKRKALKCGGGLAGSKPAGVDKEQRIAELRHWRERAMKALKEIDEELNELGAGPEVYQSEKRKKSRLSAPARATGYQSGEPDHPPRLSAPARATGYQSGEPDHPPRVRSAADDIYHIGNYQS